MSQKTLQDFKSSDFECPTCGDVFGNDVALKAHHQHHDRPYFDAVVSEEFGLSPKEFLERHYRERRLSLAEVGELFGGTIGAVKGMANRHGIEVRGISEAKKIEWEETDNPGKYLEKAHKKTRQLVEDGEHNFQDSDFERVLTDEFRERINREGIPDELAHFWKENPEMRSKWGALGAKAREENGMEGVTGQDHPSWRGGKSIYDAVKKQLHGRSWRQVKVDAKDRDGNECQMCGATDVKLDSHHIVPIMAGGTNGFWNLITLCETCHTAAEQHTRKMDEFEPVLVE